MAISGLQAEILPVLIEGAPLPKDYSWVTDEGTGRAFTPNSGEVELVETGKEPAREAQVDPGSLKLTARPGRMVRGLIRDPTPEVFDSFTLGLRQSNGTWRIVRGAPSPAITRWHWVTLGLMLRVAAIFAWLAMLVARSVVKPLDRLGREADLAGLGRDHPITATGPPEVVRVAEAVANMRDRLAGALEQRTAIFTALAHDMAAPVARLRFRLTQLPEAERTAAESDVAELSDMIAGIVEFSAIGRRRLRLETLDAVALVRDLAEREATPFTSNLVNAPVSGDALALRRLLTNLMVNARRYASGSEIAMSGDTETVSVSVLDRGPGVPAELAERLFEPFFACRKLSQSGYGWCRPRPLNRTSDRRGSWRNAGIQSASRRRCDLHARTPKVSEGLGPNLCRIRTVR